MGHLQVILATLLIAGSFVATADISQELHPLSLNLMRMSIASLVLLPFIALKKGSFGKLKKVMPRSMVISFFYCGYFACTFAALLTTSTLNVGTLYTLTPLITALLSIFILKQPLKVSNVTAYIIGMLGTLWVVFEGSYQRLLQLQFNQGDIIFSVGVLCMAGYMISLKLLYRDDDVSVMTLGNLLGGVIWMSSAVVLADIELEWASLAYRYYPSMLYLAIAATFFTSYLYQKASTVLRPVDVSSYIYLNPLCVALISMLILEGNVTHTIWLGIFISTMATIILQVLGHVQKSKAK